MIAATQIRQGMVIVLDGTLYRVMKMTHVTPGKGHAHVHTQLRNLVSGNQEEQRFDSGEKVERASLEQHAMEFLYAEGNHYHFMDNETYEQVILDGELVGDSVPYLLPNTSATLEFHDAKPVGMTLPQTVTLTIVEAEPSVKRATASASFKQATAETGLTLKVPNFVQVGDRIKVDTTTGEYVERA